MNISELSIKRPVLATVLTILIVLFGVIGYFMLGVREYPSVDTHHHGAVQLPRSQRRCD